MELEQFIQILIIIHAGFGGIALLAGGIALSAKNTSKSSQSIFVFHWCF